MNNLPDFEVPEEEIAEYLQGLKETVGDKHLVRMEVVLEDDAAIIFNFLRYNYSHDVDTFVDDIMRAGLRSAWDGFLSHHQVKGTLNPDLADIEWDI